MDPQVIQAKQPTSTQQKPKSSPNGKILNALSPRRRIPSSVVIEKPRSKQEMIQIVKTGPSKKVVKSNSTAKNDQNMRNFNDDKLEPMKPEQFPFIIDRKCLTFIGRIGDEPVVANFVVCNPTRFPYMFKVKSTSNTLFKITPHLGIVDALNNACIKVTYGGSHVPPPYQEWLSVHAMMPDLFLPNIYKAFKARRHFETRHRVHIDFAYHEDVKALVGSEPEQVYRNNEKFMNKWLSKAGIKRRDYERKERIKNNMVAKSPTRTPLMFRENIKNHYSEQMKSKENEWMKNLKSTDLKPIAKYKWAEEQKNDETKKLQDAVGQKLDKNDTTVKEKKEKKSNENGNQKEEKKDEKKEKGEKAENKVQKGNENKEEIKEDVKKENEKLLKEDHKREEKNEEKNEEIKDEKNDDQKDNQKDEKKDDQKDEKKDEQKDEHAEEKEKKDEKNEEVKKEEEQDRKEGGRKENHDNCIIS